MCNSSLSKGHLIYQLLKGSLMTRWVGFQVIDGVKASASTASGLNGRIPQERNPEIILAGFTEWSKADVKSLGQVFLSTVFADIKLEHALLYSLLSGPKTVLYNGHKKYVVRGGKHNNNIFSFLAASIIPIASWEWWPSKIMSRGLSSPQCAKNTPLKSFYT
jgi:hypothetical protein